MSLDSVITPSFELTGVTGMKAYISHSPRRRPTILLYAGTVQKYGGTFFSGHFSCPWSSILLLESFWLWWSLFFQRRWGFWSRSSTWFMAFWDWSLWKRLLVSHWFSVASLCDLWGGVPMANMADFVVGHSDFVKGVIIFYHMWCLSHMYSTPLQGHAVCSSTTNLQNTIQIREGPLQSTVQIREVPCNAQYSQKAQNNAD